MKYQYLIEFEAANVSVAEKFSRNFNELLDTEYGNRHIDHHHCWRRDGEEISQIPLEAQKQSTPSTNNESEEICPQCNGAGWYASEGDCGSIQVQCEYCQATGKRSHIS